MHHLQSNAIPTGHVQNSLSDSDEFLLSFRGSYVNFLKQNFDIIGIHVVMWASVAQNRENFEFLVNICS